MEKIQIYVCPSGCEVPEDDFDDSVRAYECGACGREEKALDYLWDGSAHGMQPDSFIDFIGRLITHWGSR